ncbi:hypothetical protein [Terracoccus sp. 273MFTsu3.1]|uniref:hypothetical protein n=1 Tax=Terracoccus sp. 273MFTsu3.1 TaxID=1172188 RepID=UPI000364FD0E|nr:hypothetical protein [Terracoccus sp. 273MFTsu3.1]
MPEFKFDVRWEWNSTVTVYADSPEEAEAVAVSAAQEQFAEEMEGSLPPQDDIEVYPISD